MSTLTRVQLAKRWGLHPNTLANWALWGKGPAFTSPKSKGRGQRGSYRLTDVERFERENPAILNRAEPGAARRRKRSPSGSEGPPGAASRAGDRPR